MRGWLFILLFVLLFSPRNSAQTYSSNFLHSENPISEGGRWINGKDVGRDWADASTTPGLAIGRQSGSGGYDDATALLTGPWGADQTVIATVHTVKQNDNYYEEVELRLRSFLSAHINAGYEINFRCLKTSDAYMEIVRWNGLLGDFTRLVHQVGPQYGVTDGDIVKATIAGNVITAYINDVELARATDNTYATGNPGLGFFLSHPTRTNANYGFRRFTATAAPSPLTSSAGLIAPRSGQESCCFIAIAAFRSPFAEEVERFRSARNRYLLSSTAGRDLAALYDRVSHPVALSIAHSPLSRDIARFILAPVGAWLALLHWSPLLATMVPLVAASLVGLGAMALIRRRR